MVRPQGRVYRQGTPVFRMTVYGHLFSRDMAGIHNFMRKGFHKTYGIPIVLGGSELLRRYVRKQMKPPRYPKDPRNNKTKWARPSTPSGGFAWYSGTLRRALHSRIAKVDEDGTLAAMLPDYNKGHPPRWNRIGNPKNAYHYARWIELGEVPKQPPRPIMRMGFNKGKKVVAQWMVDRTYADFKKVVRQHKKIRTRIPPGVK